MSEGQDLSLAGPATAAAAAATALWKAKTMLSLISLLCYFGNLL